MKNGGIFRHPVLLMQDEDEWEEELPPSDYDDKGVLTTSLSSFADLRSIARGPRPSGPAAAADSPPQPGMQQVSRDPPTEQPQAAQQTGQPALPGTASRSGTPTVSPRMVPRVLRQPEQPAAQTSRLMVTKLIEPHSKRLGCFEGVSKP